jgi:hypothetical protein
MKNLDIGNFDPEICMVVPATGDTTMGFRESLRDISARVLSPQSDTFATGIQTRGIVPRPRLRAPRTFVSLVSFAANGVYPKRVAETREPERRYGATGLPAASLTRGKRLAALRRE